MARREIPLFIVDNSRRHKRGECDFLVCTDRDNGFIAVVDYIRGEREEAGSDYTARQTTLDSISMLEASAEYLSESERH